MTAPAITAVTMYVTLAIGDLVGMNEPCQKKEA
jgi:hypothetical protein